MAGVEETTVGDSSGSSVSGNDSVTGQYQAFEKWEGMSEMDPGVWKEESGDFERLEGSCQRVGQDEGCGWDTATRPYVVHGQPVNTGKALDPTARFRNLQAAPDCQDVNAVCGGLYRIRKCPHPLAIILRLELEVDEKVFSGTWDP